MTNSKLLEDCIANCGYTKAKIAQLLGLSRQDLWKKIHNRSEFKQSEIQKLRKLLNLSFEDEKAIFLQSMLANRKHQERTDD